MLVAGYFIDACIDVIDIADRKIAGLEVVARELVRIVRDMIIELEPAARRMPDVIKALDMIARFEEMVR